jgi:integrase
LTLFLPSVPSISGGLICAVNTGMDRGEILNLKWQQIRNGFLYLGKYKTRPVRQIPINEDLDQVFEEIPKEIGVISKHSKKVKRLKAVEKTSDYVFTYGERNIKRVDRAFKRAISKTGIEDFRFKDLRHTFASHVLMRGGILKDVQELLGYKNISMTMRYAHLSQEHKNKAVNLLNGLTASKKPTEKPTCHKTVTFLKGERP